MKKTIWMMFLCMLLAASALASAEQLSAEAVLDDLTIGLSKVTMESNKLTIRLHADYPTEEAAGKYEYFMLPENPHTCNVETYFDGFLDRFSIIAVSFRTPAGDPLFPDGVFIPYDFGAFGETEQKDGTWRRDIRLNVSSFKTDEEALLMEVHILNQYGDPPYTGEPAATLYIPLR